MAKILRTSQDYTVKAGDGASGSHTIKLDSRDVRVTGNLVIDGSQVVVNTESLSIEDPIIVLNRNTSSTVLSEWDSGILVNRGESNNAALYWDGTDDVFKAVTTTSDGSGTEITETALSNIRVAEPSNISDAATKNYVDSSILSGSMSSFDVVGDDSTALTIGDSQDLSILGGRNIATSGTSATDTLTIDLDNALTDVNSVTAQSGSNLTLSADETSNYYVIVSNVMTFNSKISDPLAGSITRMYAKTPAGGGTGVFFVNSDVNSGSAGELISKKKATALAIALG